MKRSRCRVSSSYIFTRLCRYRFSFRSPNTDGEDLAVAVADCPLVLGPVLVLVPALFLSVLALALVLPSVVVLVGVVGVGVVLCRSGYLNMIL